MTKLGGKPGDIPGRMAMCVAALKCAGNGCWWAGGGWQNWGTKELTLDILLDVAPVDRHREGLSNRHSGLGEAIYTCLDSSVWKNNLHVSQLFSVKKNIYMHLDFWVWTNNLPFHVSWLFSVKKTIYMFQLRSVKKQFTSVMTLQCKKKKQFTRVESLKCEKTIYMSQLFSVEKQFMCVLALQCAKNNLRLNYSVW